LYPCSLQRVRVPCRAACAARELYVPPRQPLLRQVRLIAAHLTSPHTFAAATKSTFAADMAGLLTRADGADVTFLVG
jgi:hypothetical protein